MQQVIDGEIRNRRDVQLAEARSQAPVGGAVKRWAAVDAKQGVTTLAVARTVLRTQNIVGLGGGISGRLFYALDTRVAVKRNTQLDVVFALIQVPLQAALGRHEASSPRLIGH